MWVKSEIEDAREMYQEIKHVVIDDLCNEDEKEAIDDSAIDNLKNTIAAPRKFQYFMSTIRCQYICTDL